VKGKRLLLTTLLGLLTDSGRYLVQYLLSTYFRNTSWHCVVYRIWSSGLITIPLSHLIINRSFHEGWRICVHMRSWLVMEVTPERFFNRFCHPNFRTKYKSSFHWVYVLAKACITPWIWWNMLLNTGKTWCRVTLCLFDIRRVLEQNGPRTSMTYWKMAHSACVVMSGQFSLYFGFWSHSQVNSRNR